MWDFLKGLPTVCLIFVIGGAAGIYAGGYYTATTARQDGFEAEFSDYGLLKKISKPEPFEVKNCHELDSAYQAEEQGVVNQIRTYNERKSSDNVSLVELIKTYSDARQYDEGKNNLNSYNPDISSEKIGLNINFINSDIQDINNQEANLNQNLVLAYNNLFAACIKQH